MAYGHESLWSASARLLGHKMEMAEGSNGLGIWTAPSAQSRRKVSWVEQHWAMDLVCQFTLHVLYTLCHTHSDYAHAVQQQLFKEWLELLFQLKNTILTLQHWVVFLPPKDVLQWQNIIYGRSNFRNGHAKCSLVAMAICPIKLPDLYCALHVYLVPLLEQFSGRCETRWPCLCTQTYLAADWCHFRGQTCRSSKHMWNIANAHDLVCFESPPYHRTEQLKSLMQQKSGPIYCWYSVGAATQVDSQRLAHRSV